MLWIQPAPALVTADGWIKHGSANCPTGVAVWLRVSVQCGDETIAMILVDGGQEFWYFYHTDGLGSVAALSQWNTAGSQVEIVERYRYDYVFGQTTVCDGGNWLTADTTTYTASAIGNPYLFTGRRWDSAAKLYYYRFRDYAPLIGRFCQTDPMGYIDGMNLYAYVNNNPLNWTDPWGLATYRGRRTIGGNKRVHPNSLIAHEYIVVEHGPGFGNFTTYSYTGENKRNTEWVKDDPRDRAAAGLALLNDGVVKIGDDSLDPYIEKEFQKRKGQNLGYGFFRDNCKHKAKELIDDALNARDEGRQQSKES